MPVWASRTVSAAPREARRRRFVPAAVTATAVCAAAVATLVSTAAPAQAAPAPALAGRIGAHWQSTITHQIHVSGWARNPAMPHRPVRVGLVVDGSLRRTIIAARPTSTHGRHGFSAILNSRGTARRVTIVVRSGGVSRATPVRALRHRAPKGERVVQAARRLVGSRYVWGAAGPRAFDCSGYAMYVYRKAGVTRLPHNAEAQMRSRHMRRISRAHAEPGDLVFYLSGSHAYHVAVYAGHGMEYSATDPAVGVRYQRVWGRNIRFGTDWH